MRKKYRLFGIVNVFDLVLIIACAVLVYGAYLFAAPTRVVAGGGDLIRFTVELAERPPGFYTQIVEGPLVFDSQSGTAIGNVVYAYELPFMVDAPDEYNDIIRRVPVEDSVFTYVVVEAWGNVTDFQTEVNGFRIMVNRDVYIRSRDFAGRGFITHLEFLD